MPITVVIDVNIRRMRETFRANQRGIRDVVGKSLLNRAQYTARLAASLAPIDTGQLRASAKVTKTTGNNFRISFNRRVRQSTHGRGFDIAFWLHEARNPRDGNADRFSYTPGALEIPLSYEGFAPSYGGGIDLQSVGRKYLERASLASVESIRIETSRDLQQFFDQNERGIGGSTDRRRLTRAGRQVEGARPTRRAGPTRRTRPDADSQSTGRMTVRQIEDRMESILEEAGSVEAAARDPRFGSLRKQLGELEGF